MSGPKKGRERRLAIQALARPYLDGVVVDVGADHGHVASSLAREHDLVIATERRSNRLPRWPSLRVVADGLAPFRRVDLAIVCGMGPHSILHVLSSGPEVGCAVLHSPDRTDTLRRGLKEQGWRIDAERLAPENGRYAELIRVLPGQEPSEGHALAFGPRLLHDPHIQEHIAHTRAHWQSVVDKAPAESQGAQRARGWLDWLTTLG